MIYMRNLKVLIFSYFCVQHVILNIHFMTWLLEVRITIKLLVDLTIK